MSAINASKRKALELIILIGVVSLFADMTYEGARSISGPYLGVLGATGAVVGIVSGLGELIGYTLRLFSGYLSDRTRRYWTIAISGYAINLFAVPFLALARHWELAAALLILERTGKGLRSPAKDAILSHATSQVGHGRGFGLHEFLDQLGAVSGPLIVLLAMGTQGNYPRAFFVLLFPAIAAIGMLVVARRQYPAPETLDRVALSFDSKGFPKVYWIYLTAVIFVAAGFADFPLIAFHFKQAALVPDELIPAFYAVAMLSDGLGALLFGFLFDRFGIVILCAAVLISAGFAPLVFFGGRLAAWIGVVLWGFGLGAQESILRAAIAQIIPRDRRGSAYGIFYAGYGVFWFLGSTAMGILYDTSLLGLVIFSVAAQLLSLPLFLRTVRDVQAGR